MRFELAREALADIEGIADYTAERWGAAQAREYLAALEARLRELARSPLLGRRRDDLAEGLLSLPSVSHVVFYKRADFGVVVIRVLHRRQDPQRHLG